MKAFFKTTKPDEIEFSLTIVMPLAAWKKLKAQLTESAYPSWELSLKIRDLVDLAEQKFEQKAE